jgi:hypothetical protein
VHLQVSFTDLGWLDTDHSKSAKHQQMVANIWQLDRFIGEPDPDQTHTIRNLDRMVEHGAAAFGMPGALDQLGMLKWYGKALAALPAQFRKIHQVQGYVSADVPQEEEGGGQKNFKVFVLPEHVHAYTLGLVQGEILLLL